MSSKSRVHNQNPKPFKKVCIKEKSKKPPSIHIEINSAVYEVFGMLIEKYRSAYSNAKRNEMIFLITKFRELWPSECEGWELAHGPAF